MSTQFGPALPPLAWGPAPVVSRPRSRRIRIWLMSLYLVSVPLVMAMVAGSVLAIAEVFVNRADYLDGAAYDAAVVAAALPWMLVASPLAILLALALAARRVGYHGWDAVVLLSPLMWPSHTLRILWRWTDVEHWRS